MKATSITEVIDQLSDIIEESKRKESPLGYFAALYQKVTMSVEAKIEEGFFEDNERMERLDVIFANRYLTAYHDYQAGKPITAAWERAFELAKSDQLIVLQHLLLGMNAHINLDLGIAAAEVTNKADFDTLRTDFNKINDILFALVKEVESDLAEIWPTLLWILKFTQKIDDFLVRFSMQLARDGAWKFASKVVGKNTVEKAELIQKRDKEVVTLDRLIVPKGLIERFLFWIVRIGEKGTTATKITALENKKELFKFLKS